MDNAKRRDATKYKSAFVTSGEYRPASGNELVLSIVAAGGKNLLWKRDLGFSDQPIDTLPVVGGSGTHVFNQNVVVTHDGWIGISGNPNDITYISLVIE